MRMAAEMTEKKTAKKSTLLRKILKQRRKYSPVLCLSFFINGHLFAFKRFSTAVYYLSNAINAPSFSLW